MQETEASLKHLFSSASQDNGGCQDEFYFCCSKWEEEDPRLPCKSGHKDKMSWGCGAQFYSQTYQLLKPNHSQALVPPACPLLCLLTKSQSCIIRSVYVTFRFCWNILSNPQGSLPLPLPVTSHAENTLPIQQRV